jgi:hypothetical protein
MEGVGFCCVLYCVVYVVSCVSSVSKTKGGNQGIKEMTEHVNAALGRNVVKGIAMKRRAVAGKRQGGTEVTALHR